MPNVWFTSDTHFGHNRIMSFCAKTRPYSSTEEMNEKLIEQWNAVVRPGDEVWHLGDVAFDSNPEQFVGRLNGQKHLILGNHDQFYEDIFTGRSVDTTSFTSINKYMRIRRAKQQIVLFHYPIADWDLKVRGSWHLFGHVHGKPQPITGPAVDVGVDSTGLAVISLDQLFEKFSAK